VIIAIIAASNNKSIGRQHLKNLFFLSVGILTMSSRSMGAGKQVVRPPQRGIFPLDHGAECRASMEKYLSCLEENKEVHHKCRDYSKDYLQCRMDHQLMAKENLDQLGFSEEAKVHGAKEYDNSKEMAGFIAGKHISNHKQKWWWESNKKQQPDPSSTQLETSSNKSEEQSTER
jgi:hypothetical protein